MSPSRVFTAQRAIERSPWDVYELLTDEAQQYRWRDRWSERHHAIVEADPYTRVVFDNGEIFEIEPHGEGGSSTMLSVRRTFHAEGKLAKVSLRMRSKKNFEEEMETELKRIESCLVFGDL